MKKMKKMLFTAAAIAGVVFALTATAHAAPPNPSNGYSSVHDNILDKGANHGRCNAVGVLAGKVCDNEGALVPAIELVMPLCLSVGVDLDQDPAITPCMEELSCEDLGTC